MRIFPDYPYSELGFSSLLRRAHSFRQSDRVSFRRNDVLYTVHESLDQKCSTAFFCKRIVGKPCFTTRRPVLASVRDFDPNGFVYPSPPANNFRFHATSAAVFHGIVQCLRCRKFQLGPGLGRQTACLKVFLHCRQRLGDELKIRSQPTLPDFRIGKVCSHTSGRRSARCSICRCKSRFTVASGRST